MEIYVDNESVIIQWHKHGPMLEVTSNGEAVERLRVLDEPVWTSAELTDEWLDDFNEGYEEGYSAAIEDAEQAVSGCYSSNHRRKRAAEAHQASKAKKEAS